MKRRQDAMHPALVSGSLGSGSDMPIMLGSWCDRLIWRSVCHAIHTHTRAPSSRIFVWQITCHEQYHSPSIHVGSKGAKGMWSLTGESDCIGTNILTPQLSGDGSQTQDAAALVATKWSDSWGITMVYRHIDSSHQHAQVHLQRPASRRQCQKLEKKLSSARRGHQPRFPAMWLTHSGPSR
ncbi:hypothetical protein BDP81DRAFT_84671 [Colletotrichum phormii]|uniref:Uncharacterized protein n=1 Tax=Colletotrichum phormii TaxID=359342 RepID=A0AAJ0EKF4_9PEZI|nr:uncharacterized protein BDP81DRAFT_84671 [Colletotrichum phormii]KAK1654527.1 hypothetical protein BDP81DRAFT_84671 [Colletotrichum phormii]